MLLRATVRRSVALFSLLVDPRRESCDRDAHCARRWRNRGEGAEQRANVLGPPKTKQKRSSSVGFAAAVIEPRLARVFQPKLRQAVLMAWARFVVGRF